LREFVAQALPRIASVHPDVKLVIVGNAPEHALHAQAQLPSDIQANANVAGVGQCLKFLGVITDYVVLSDIYRGCDVHVFPVRDIPGDPEGFGMVAVEAAAHGLPTVAFAVGGVPDAVRDGVSGYLVPPGDYAQFAARCIELLRARASTPLRARARRFAEGFAWNIFGAQLCAQVRGQATDAALASDERAP
jgi:phosphatidylinositol alpha-1,6-mannosyltransferase